MEQNRNMAWNQLGFLPGARKEVTLFDAEGESRIDLKEQGSDKIVASFDLQKPRMNADTGNVCSRGDFSAFKDQGTFYLQAGDHKSEPFTIGEDVYDQVFSELIYMLHLQRCGCELTSEEAGEFAHASCHDTPARIYGTDETMDATGGWHDAGDYGRYIVPAAKTVVDLLMAYEHYQEVMEKNIPKKGPALLDEVRYEIDWMLKMQRADGGVYHKVTCASFPDMDIMPEEEREELIVCPVSNASTACFAASLSYASTIYKKTDAAYADRVLKAAELAYAYLSEHMDEPGFKNPQDIQTGEYGDENWIDDYFWAVARLYQVTGKEVYHDAVKKIIEDERALSRGLGWEWCGSYGALAYLEAKENNPVIREKLLQFLIDETDDYATAAEKDAFGASITDGVYVWGSNMQIANHGMLAGLMIQGGYVDARQKERYQKLLERQIAYLLGQNGLGYCYVTGFGVRPCEHPHHRPSVAVGKAMPGMLSGGPDSGLHDPFAVEALTGKAPQLCYLDRYESYSTNEITIYWNTPLIYILAEVISIYEN